ncbi:MAG TPA: TRAP transporter large permease subunit, partial [Burkholderiales bacterium]|nr:TRAP transporter large permease subunit [Burkholderiales bacterium]
LIFGFVGLGSMVFDLAYLQILGLMKQDEFVAVPMFVLMGYICDQAGLMERLFKAFRDLFAPVRGSLYLVVLLTATLFGIAAGTVGATVVLLGIMAGPMMIKTGYDPKLSAGAITAGGTLGILIPPSVMLVVMGPVLGVSVLQLYAAAFGPGFLLAGMYIAYTMGRSFVNPKLGPPVPVEERVHSMKTIVWECIVGLVPVTVLTIATLGVILAGITTSTEAAAMGAAGAILLVIAYGRFTWKGLFSACHSTLASTSMVLFLAVASNVFGAVFARLGTATWITNALLAVPLPAWGTMTLLLTLIFLLGWPFEWPAIVLIFLPMLAPVATGLGYDMVWFGTIVAVVLQTAFLSPPVAMSAYYLKQVVKDWSLSTIYRGMYQFMVIQCICVALVLVFPDIAMWFPRWLEAGDRMAAPAQNVEQPADNPLEAGDRMEDK